MSSAASIVRERSDETENVLRYRSIVEAVRIINKSKQQVHEEEDLGFSISPAWRLLTNSANHLLDHANMLLCGDVLE
jgi:hypothetical protein